MEHTPSSTCCRVICLPVLLHVGQSNSPTYLCSSKWCRVVLLSVLLTMVQSNSLLCSSTWCTAICLPLLLRMVLSNLYALCKVLCVYMGSPQCCGISNHQPVLLCMVQRSLSTCTPQCDAKMVCYQCASAQCKVICIPLLLWMLQRNLSTCAPLHGAE